VASPLRERDFRILFAGRVVDALGDAVTPAALALAIVTASRSSAGLAVVLICGMLPRVALLPFAGVDPAGRKAANSLLGAASSGAFVAGPVIAGALIFTVGAGWAFVLDAATFAVSAGTLAVIHVRDVPVPGGPLRRQLAAGWAEVRDRTWYWASIIGHGTCNFALGMLVTTGPLIAVTELGGKAVWLAALEASAAGYLVGTVIAGQARISRPILAVDLVLVSVAAPLVLFGLAAPAWSVVAAYGLAAVGLGFANPVWLTAVQQEVPAEVLARVSAYDWLVSLGGQLLGYAVGPTLTQVAGFTWPLSTAAALVVVTLLVPASLPSVRGLRLAL
jgi:hypothetical protein